MENALQLVQIFRTDAGIAVVYAVDGFGGIEQVRNHDGRVQVVAHSLFATSAQATHIDGRSGAGSQFLQTTIRLGQSRQTALGGHQRIVAEVERAAVVRLKNEKPDGHRGKWLRQQFMRTSEKLVERDKIAEALAHLLTIDGYHVVVHPVVHRFVSECRHALRNLAFVVRKHQIHAAAVNVELLTEIFRSHGRALQMPAGKALAPRTWPVHNVFGRGLFPQRKIHAAAFLLLSVEFARGRELLVDIAPRKSAVVVFLVVFFHIEIDRPVALVGVARRHYLFHKFYLLDDMPRRVRLDAGRQHIQPLHRLVVAQSVVFGHLHRLQLFEACFFGNFVLAVVGIVFEVSHIGNVAHIAHFVAEVREVAKQHIEGNRRPCMPQMCVAIDRRAAHIKPHMRCVQRPKCLFLPRQCVVNQ